MHIWLVQIGEPLPLDSSVKKMRTALLADKLIERGHTVLWWASAFDHVKKKWVAQNDSVVEIKNGYEIFALKGIGYKKNISLSRFIDHRIIARNFKKFALQKTKPDAMIVSMPAHDLAYQAVMFAKKNNIPVIVDVRDEWPDLFVNYAPSVLRPFTWFFLFNDFAMVKKTMHYADSLVSMMDSLLQWGLKYAGRKQTENDKVFYLGGKKIVNENKNINLSFSEKLKDKFVVTFIGTFVENNDPAILIVCAKKLQNEKIHFLLAGDGELLHEIKKKTKDLNNVTFPGWLNENEINELLKISKIGVAPAKKIRDAFPNKVFSYLSAGLPVITSFHGDLKNSIEEHQIGYFYLPNDVTALTNCILKLYKDQDLYRKMLVNTKKIFEEKFDAEKIYDEYAKHVELIAEKYKQ
ncbi:MAG: glycosyltransferase family 4 protein [Bacteroidetes bacterium]|nr:glycosyltransferase family 4 protein [Bacteroidota bacterium]